MTQGLKDLSVFKKTEAQFPAPTSGRKQLPLLHALTHTQIYPH